MQQCCAWVHHHSDTYRLGISLPVILEAGSASMVLPLLSPICLKCNLPDWAHHAVPLISLPTSTHMCLSAPAQESGHCLRCGVGQPVILPLHPFCKKIPQNPVYPGIFPSRKQLYACPRYCFPYFLPNPSNPQPSCYCSLPEKNKIRALSFISGAVTADPAFSRKTGPYTGPAFSWRRPRLPGDGFQR